MNNKKAANAAAACLAAVGLFCALRCSALEQIFYRPQAVGSEALYNPFASFLTYTLDSTQIRGSFGTDDFSDHLDIVLDNLTHIDRSVRREGGYREFINTEIVPIDADDLSKSKAALPNYALHLFGGGLLFRKDAEYFAQRGVAYPRTLAAIVGMVAEVLQEGTEKPRTDYTDEIADVLLFRPLGMWLFSDDLRARWIRRTLAPVDWPYLLMYDLDNHAALNAGVSYVLRPPRQETGKPGFFAYLGLTNLFGMAHPLGSGSSFSWGVGVATESIKPNHVRVAGGVFYDRNSSLLWSAIINGTEQLRLRANIYPGAFWSARQRIGVFVGLTDENKPAFGLQFGLPIGLGARRE